MLRFSISLPLISIPFYLFHLSSCSFFHPSSLPFSSSLVFSFIFFLFFLLPSSICPLSFSLVYVPPVLYVRAPLLLSILCNASCRHVPTSSTGGPCPTLSPDAETASEDRDRNAWTPYAPVSRVLFPCTASTNRDNVQGISAFQPPLRQDDVRPFRRAFGDSLHLQIRGVQFFDSFHWFSYTSVMPRSVMYLLEIFSFQRLCNVCRSVKS